MDYKDFYREHWWVVWALVIGLPVLVLAVGCLVWPEAFWDGYVYRYLWGPVVADAQDQPQGDVVEGYTAVSTLTYATVLAVAVVGIWRAFSYLDIRLDARFLLALVPWIALGSELRALEDAFLFTGDGHIIYLFISPLIYLLIGLVVFARVLVSKHIENLGEERGRDEALKWSYATLALINIPPALVHALWPGEMAAHAPYWLLPLISLGGAAFLWWWSGRTGRVSMQLIVFVQGAVLALLALYYIALWSSGGEWAVTDKPLRGQELLVIPALAAASTAATYGLYWALSRRWETARPFLTQVSMLLFMCHFLDGAATFRGLEAYGYAEKHVVPSLLIDATGTAAVMLPLKFLVVTMVVYVLDIAYREDIEQTPTLGWLVRVAVMVLGLAPGMRDMLRLAMGV